MKVDKQTRAFQVAAGHLADNPIYAAARAMSTAALKTIPDDPSGMSEPILTDGQGRPIERPDPPQDASLGALLAYVRDRNDFNDRVAALANRAFTESIGSVNGKRCFKGGWKEP